MSTRIADSFRTLIKKLHLAEAGATAVEYGLMVALIAAVVIGGAYALGTATEECFNDTAKAIASASGTDNACIPATSTN